MAQRYHLAQTIEDSGMTLTCVQTVEDGIGVQISAIFTRDRRAIHESAWCACDEDPLATGDGVYFRDEITGSHGWACPTCRKIAQTG